MNSPQKAFDDLIQTTSNDPNVLAFITTGSRGKGRVTEHSDYDCMLIVSDATNNKFKAYYSQYGRPEIEVVGIFTLDEFKKYAAWGSATAWDRYNFAHLKPTFDKTGQIQDLINQKSIVPGDKQKEFISDSLDGYINQTYRSLKALRDGNPVAARLKIAESIHILLNALFALDGKVRPYYKYLEWELEHYPLKKFPWSTQEFIAILMTLLDSADPTTQQELFKAVETLFRNAGFGHVFDAWGDKIKWIKTVDSTRWMS